MQNVPYRYNQVRNKRRLLPKWLEVVLIVLGALAALFVLANLVMLLFYRNKVLPNYSVAGVGIGNVSFDQLNEKVPAEKLLPAKVKLTKEDRTKEMAPNDLGVTVDWDATQDNIKRNRNWLPLLSLVSRHVVPAELKLDNAQFATAVKDLEVTFTKQPLPEHIEFDGQNFEIAAPESGYQIEVVQLRIDLIGLLERGKSEMIVPTKITSPPKSAEKLEDDLSILQRQLNSKITLISGSKKKLLTRSDLGGFYAVSGVTMELSESNMAKVLSKVSGSLGANAPNQSETIQASYYALNKQKPVNFVLAAKNATVHSYCVAVKGVANSVIPEYRQKLAVAYADPSGWSNGTNVTFVYAENNCDYTAWLSSAANMTTFSSSICDNYYSCRVGSNVIVNYDRWQGATEPWNDAGGSLEDYRVMVINHETGHWLGFGHRNCTGAGQPAPVMQQQSIDLQGCKFNPWPTAAELAVL